MQPSAEPTTTRKNSRGEATRERIIRVTAAMLAAQPPSEVSLDKIAKEAAVAKSSLLWHFGNKEKIFLAVIDHAFSVFETSLVLQLDPEAPPVQMLAVFLDAYCDFLQAHPEINAILFALLFDAQADSDVRVRIREMYATFRARAMALLGGVEGGVAEPVAALPIALVDGLFLQWFIDPRGVDLAATFTAARDLLLSAQGSAS